ncbi:prolyl oligopeptidase family serine peptidase [Cellulosimicrobium arenosum]|uniref:Prolyl oligopeptidase family serine peptidase n=1 Tax=Cellulosimicrobium arenosum TaxID=2708133 RepID=A0A927G835_9MICO|nr:prolyl oligopeptidase family serine peptidase [Cellulosimicrobium arenosum]MBD8078646.1 prolyl oligopeptidase family serine peptidase [Cellulosimicrobium arenosum]
MKSIRTASVVASAVVLALVTALPGSAHGGHGGGGHGHHPFDPGTVSFTLDGTVLDGGEQVTSVTLDLDRLPGIRAASVDPSAFTVQAVGRLPEGVATGGPSDVVFDVDRTVTDVEVTRGGDVRLSLAAGAGAGTLQYLPEGRNVLLDLDYTIAQDEPIELRNGREVTVERFRQGDLRDPEVDAFARGTTRDGLKYRLYEPARTRGDRPLVVWLHGNGEGGLPGVYQNEAQLRANRGALGFTTREAQRIFGGAYVVAPQVPDTWYNADEAGYREQLRTLVAELSRTYDIDQSRIHVAGASAGGLMSIELVAAYPTTFASLVSVAPAITLFRDPTYRTDAEEVSRLADTPTWFIHSRDDATVPYDRSSVWAHDLLPDSLITLYDSVEWDEQTYPGHFSWIYLAQNDPMTADGTSVWRWMSQQMREGP